MQFCCFAPSPSSDGAEDVGHAKLDKREDVIPARHPKLPGKDYIEAGRPQNGNASSHFSEVCQAYSRGAFDPANPSGSRGKGIQDPTPPRTPTGEAPVPPNATHSTSYDFRSHCSSSNSHGSHQTNSSSLRSSDSNKSRPQPLEELQERIRGRMDANPGDPAVQSKPSGAVPSNSKHSGRTTSGKSGGHSWLSGKEQKAEQGSPVKEAPLPPIATKHSAEGAGMHDPLEGNPHFELIRPLVPGAVSSVYLCRDRRDGERVAIKLVSRGVANAKAAEREIANLRLCALHPYIVHLREVFLTSAHLAIVFDYASGGNLAHYIETFQSSKPGRGISEERTRWIFQQIVVAVDFCHRLGIANRDIKLENVLLVPASQDPTKPPIVKLSDFGFSKDELADSLCKTACGTPECVAPEILSGELYSGIASDIWSLGVLFFAMLTGTFPFSRPSDDNLDNTLALRKLFSRIARAQYPVPQHVSRAGRDLLHRMLQVNPEERIDIAGILAHPWFGDSLQSVALNVNKGLLEMPDSMLTGFAKQSDEEIGTIVLEASQRIISRPEAPLQTREASR